MSPSRAITWARLRVYFGMLLFVLFALGGLLIYASFLVEPVSGHSRSDFRTSGAALIALSVIAGILAAALKKRFVDDE